MYFFIGENLDQSQNGVRETVRVNGHMSALNLQDKMQVLMNSILNLNVTT